MADPDYVTLLNASDISSGIQLVIDVEKTKFKHLYKVENLSTRPALHQRCVNDSIMVKYC